MKILFVCLGNICRSPMAEFVMKDMVRKAELAGNFEIASGGYQPGGDREPGLSSCPGKTEGAWNILRGEMRPTDEPGGLWKI